MKLSQRSARVFQNLNACIDASTDSEKGFAVAAADVRDPALKSLFERYASERAEHVRALQAAVERMGVVPVNGGTVRGTLHRGWMETKRVVRGPADRFVLEECERGERQALATYDDAFVECPLDDLPPRVRALLIDQRAHIATAHAELEKRLADA